MRVFYRLSRHSGDTKEQGGLIVSRRPTAAHYKGCGTTSPAATFFPLLSSSPPPVVSSFRHESVEPGARYDPPLVHDSTHCSAAHAQLFIHFYIHFLTTGCCTLQFALDACILFFHHSQTIRNDEDFCGIYNSAARGSGDDCSRTPSGKTAPCSIQSRRRARSQRQL